MQLGDQSFESGIENGEWIEKQMLVAINPKIGTDNGRQTIETNAICANGIDFLLKTLR